jgi:hypothetical protein
MTLAEKISLVDQFIKKEPDTTIKDFLEAVKEIEGIEKIDKIKKAISIVNDGTPLYNFWKGRRSA